MATGGVQFIARTWSLGGAVSGLVVRREGRLVDYFTGQKQPKDGNVRVKAPAAAQDLRVAGQALSLIHI